MLNTNDDVNVSEYVETFRRHWLTIALIVGAGALVGAVMAVAAPQLYVAQVTLAVPKGPGAPDALAVSNMVPLIANPSAASRIVGEFHLDHVAHPVAPQDLFSRVVTVERDGAVIVITTRMRDPKLTSQVAARVAELGIETAQRFAATERTRTLDTLKAQMDAAKAQLGQASAARDAADLTAARAMLTAVEQQLKSPSGEGMAVSGNPRARDAYVEKLAQIMAETRATIAALEQRSGPSVLAVPSGDAAGRSPEADEERAVALSVYNELAANYARARIRDRTDPPVLQLLASPPSSAPPVARHFVRTAAVGAAIGFIWGSLLVLVVPEFRRRSVSA